MASIKQEIKLVHVTTIPLTIWTFMGGQIRFMKERGFTVEAITSPGFLMEEVKERDGITVHELFMVRGISLRSDLASFYRLFRLLRRIKPVIIHGHTPKAAVLAMSAGALAMVPVRVYTVHGLMAQIAPGKLRYLMKALEWITCKFASQVLSVSKSVADTLVGEGLCAASKIKILGRGSSNGINCEKFSRRRLSPDQIEKFRAEHGLSGNVMTIGFVGRIVRDKGINELISAFDVLKEEFPSLHLLMVGPFESRDAVAQSVTTRIEEDSRIHYIEWLQDVTPAYVVMDLLALPTYREGFPNVPIEAAAMELPVVATRVTGCVDAVVDGETGILVPLRDQKALAEAMRRLILDPELRAKMGKAGRERVIRDYKSETIWTALSEEYVRLLKEKGFSVPGPES